MPLVGSAPPPTRVIHGLGRVSIVLDVADTAFAQLKGVARDGRRSAARRAAAAVHAAANLPDAEDES